MEQFFQSTAVLAALPFVESIALIVIGFVAYRILGKWLNKLLHKTTLDPMIFNFITHVFQIGLWVFIGVAVLGKLGINSSSILTVIAACGAAIALALQNSLSNLASGILIMSTRPFHKGDYIICNGVAGTVDAIDLLFTIIHTDEGRKITIPNSLLTSNAITNYTQNGARRYQMLIGIEYSSDIELARKVLTELLKSDPRTLDNPGFGVDVAQYSDSSIILNVRSWAKSDVFLRYSCDMNNAIKPTLDKVGVGIPFPQMDVHIDK